jgi:hypothetical protein
MSEGMIRAGKRRPRFWRASQPPAFRLTEGDVVIVRIIARHRFLRSTQIAALVGRSVDRTNDRLLRLFHAGYVDRPRAQLDYYPTSGSAPMVYALADGGARLLRERGQFGSSNLEITRKNREAGRPFIEHQLEVTDFQLAIQQALKHRAGILLISQEELIASFPGRARASRNPLALRATVRRDSDALEVSAVPDLVFGLRFLDESRRCFMVEIDRGTMPIRSTDFMRSSFERKMLTYLAAHASGEHDRQFGWRTFRVLTVTTTREREHSMVDALALNTASRPGSGLFLFSTRDDLRATDPIAHTWRDGHGRQVRLA